MNLWVHLQQITQRHPAFRSPNTPWSPKMMLPTIVPTDVREFGTNAGCNHGHLESLLFSIRRIRSKEYQLFSGRLKLLQPEFFRWNFPECAAVGWLHVFRWLTIMHKPLCLVDEMQMFRIPILFIIPFFCIIPMSIGIPILTIIPLKSPGGLHSASMGPVAGLFIHHRGSRSLYKEGQGRRRWRFRRRGLGDLIPGTFRQLKKGPLS